MSGYTDGYEVTPDGRVYSTASNWRGYGRRELVQQLNAHGYPSVRMQIGGLRRRQLVHRLVAGAYLPKRPSPEHEVRHLNGNKTDNRAENLAWGTRKENAADRELHGRTSRGASHSAAIRAGRSDALSEVERRSVSRLYAKGWTQRAIAERLNRSQSAIGAVIRNEVRHG